GGAQAAADSAGPARPVLPAPLGSGGAVPGARLRVAAPAVPLRPAPARRLQRRGHRADRRCRPRAGGADRDDLLLPRDAAAAEPYRLEADLTAGAGHLGREGPLPPAGAGRAVPRLGPGPALLAHPGSEPLGPGRRAGEGQRVADRLLPRGEVEVSRLVT